MLLEHASHVHTSILDPLEAHKKQNESKKSQQNEQKTLLQMGGRGLGERDGTRDVQVMLRSGFPNFISSRSIN